MNRYDHYFDDKSKARCCGCGDAILCYPFLSWVVGSRQSEIYFCGECCQQIKRGFTADLIQVTAIMELQALGSDTVLIRRTTKEATDDAKQRHDKMGN